MEILILNDTNKDLSQMLHFIIFKILFLYFIKHNLIDFELELMEITNILLI